MRPLAVVNHQRLAGTPTFPPCGERLSRRGDHRLAGPVRSGATPKDVLETLFSGHLAALKAPPVVDAFHKQSFNTVPNKSLDDAKPWLADQIKSWKDIASAVKIETAE